MNLKFWKKNAPKENGDAATTGKPGLLARMTARFKRPAPFKAEITESASADTPAPNRTKRIGLIAGGIALLLSLLIALGYAAWKIMQASPDPAASPQQLLNSGHVPASAPTPASEPASAEPAVSAPAAPEPAASAAIEAETAHETTAVSSPEATGKQPEKHETAPAATIMPATDAKTTRTEAAKTEVPGNDNAQVEELKKQNAELQKQVNALKNEQRRSSNVRMYPGRSGPVAGGSVTVESSDPKSAASTLKDAIDAMNAGDSRSKPATGGKPSGKDAQHE